VAEAEEEAKVVEEAPAKGKSKFPIIVILLLVLGGGGFFTMKLRGGPAKKPEIKLSSEKPVELKEFLVNLHDRGVYCRTELALGVAEGVDPKSLDDHMSLIRDAVNLRLTSESLANVRTPAGLEKLKRQLASDINADLNALDPKKAQSAGASTDKAKTTDPDKAAPPEHPDWDSDTGPVLKVYFNSFATQ
jgi:flagellar basal body-associated protein FliL